MDKDIQIIVRGVENPNHLREFAQEKVHRAIERFDSHVMNATLRLEDETGPGKGGIDKICSLEVKLRTGDVRIKEQADHFEAAIHTGCDRLKAALSREVGRAKHGVAEG